MDGFTDGQRFSKQQKGSLSSQPQPLRVLCAVQPSLLLCCTAAMIVVPAVCRPIPSDVCVVRSFYIAFSWEKATTCTTLQNSTRQRGKFSIPITLEFSFHWDSIGNVLYGAPYSTQRFILPCSTSVATLFFIPTEFLFSEAFGCITPNRSSRILLQRAQEH